LPEFKCRKIKICQGAGEINNLSDFHNYDFRKYKGKQPINKIARNLVDYEAGKTIFECAQGIYNNKKSTQINLF